METPFIELKGITKYYEMGDQIVKALDGIDIDVLENDYLTIPPCVQKTRPITERKSCLGLV